MSYIKINKEACCPKCGSNDYYFDGLCDVCLSCGYWTR